VHSLPPTYAVGCTQEAGKRALWDPPGWVGRAVERASGWVAGWMGAQSEGISDR